MTEGWCPRHCQAHLPSAICHAMPYRPCAVICTVLQGCRFPGSRTCHDSRSCLCLNEWIGDDGMTGSRCVSPSKQNARQGPYLSVALPIHWLELKLKELDWADLILISSFSYSQLPSPHFNLLKRGFRSSIMLSLLGMLVVMHVRGTRHTVDAGQ